MQTSGFDLSIEHFIALKIKLDTQKNGLKPLSLIQLDGMIGKWVKEYQTLDQPNLIIAILDMEVQLAQGTL